MLAKRAIKEYTEENFAQTEQFAKLSPDFITLWNFRREILLDLWEKADTEKRLSLVQYELVMIFKHIRRSPKSYTLFNHRQWIIGLGLPEESKVTSESKILAAEFVLIGKMLEADERNFHAWNYRLWAVETKIDKLSEQPQETESFLEAECQMAQKMIERNFNNYSAWHFRGLLLPKIHSSKPGSYSIPFEIIK